MPALTLRDILALDPVRGSEPELLAGEGALDRPVRWVHSSEVYEGANFLDGGELLLTNGFGLTDADEDTRRRYVRELTARGAAGLAVEVGRSLVRMPEEVVDEARRLGLPLLALHRVVPFVRITEAANRAIVARGLSGRAASMRPWGGDHTAALLADLADGQALNQPEVEARAALAGFHPGPGARLVGVSAHGARELGVVDRAARSLGGVAVLRAAFPGDVLALVAMPDDAVRAVTARRDVVRAVQEAFRTVAEAGMTVAVGHAVLAGGGWLRWSETLRAARTTLELALTVPSAEPGPTGGPVVTSSRALTLERELTRGGVDANRDRLARLVQHTLGPLLAWEAAHPSDLVRTLEIHLRHGCSPTRTAALLHIGRQSLYQRLERIESLLGLEIDDPDLLGELLAALCAQRIVRGVPATADGGLRTVA
ncbi:MULTISPECIES: PucR family transcriptional regulator [Streptomyces]|uniref:PucR family transcriptional regulator n=1 Tax=Streptomyces TaxID=1883 RepID=UPI001164D58E|nr:MULTISPECIES: PucR family transcriptional regulator [unclassified Streptomyces]NMI60121.1 PucR family transcriptional regulator [Streptomyces sp. RLA2-12]QDN59322.1 PucR family transcriptional regulator [Streptomyces sp. S1D4-20]QDN69398.1 PucR family transcriptional regulator [Streptomyces sp. S1D4-14]QDN89405.1 PucR family transcriptional regulator [Streptomyces sp. RLB3-6]QDO10252.1 PucR family transcriptional regulator [Streptomyces sp. S1D4-23]